MKLAYVVAGFPKGSETFVYREVAGLKELGHDVEVFAFVGPSASDLQTLSPVAHSLFKETRYIDHVSLPRGLTRSAGSLRAHRLNLSFQQAATAKSNPVVRLARAGAIARRIAGAGFDRIHAHWPYGSQVGALVHALTDIPFGVSIHAHEVVEDNGHFAPLFSQVDVATFCNETAMRHLLKQLPSGTERRCHMVYHGVDLGMFFELPTQPVTGSLHLLSIGRLTAVKKFDRLITLVAMLTQRGLDLRLTLVGGGTDHELLSNLAVRLGVADRVHITGWLPQERVRDHLEQCHLFVLIPDADHNGVPNVVVEAQAAGRPALISPIPAAEEAVCNGVTGWVLSRPDATDEIESILRGLLQNPERLRVMGAAAREHARERFDSQVHIRHLADVLKRGGAQVAAPPAPQLSV